MKIKHPLMAHQVEALKFCNERAFYALLMEQGTGKTPVEIHDVAMRHCRGEINTMIVIAPNGVQSNWSLREVPKHMPQGVEVQCAAWYSGANKKQAKAVEALLDTPPSALRMLCINYEALLTEDGFKFTSALARASGGKLKLTCDESQRIKNHRAAVTKAVGKLRALSCVRSILTGTPVLNTPWDAFSQFMFLDEHILRSTSYAALRAEYAELLPSTHGLLRHIAMRKLPEIMKRFRHTVNQRALMEECAGDQALFKQKMQDAVIKYWVENGHGPAIVGRDEEGRPKWRNLERLAALTAPHSFRVLKAECLDLPEKIYTQRFYTFSAKQQKIYDQLKEEFRITLANGTVAPLERLAALQKLTQVCSGYFLIPGTRTVQRVMALDKNPKMAVLLEELDGCVEAGEQVIVWANFQAEIEDLHRVLDERKIAHSLYYGAVSSKLKRNAAIDDFEAGRTQVFVSNQAAGGVGLTLIAAASQARAMTVLYYSNSNKLGDRLQSEDRAHRIGQHKNVRYVDILGEDSIEISMLRALEFKQDVADLVTGDAQRALKTLLNFQ